MEPWSGDWPEGYDRIWLDEVDSTNEEARRRAATGLAGPVWIGASRQIAGRGRRGRPWRSAEGNLVATLLIRPDEAPADAALRSFVVAVAIAEMAEALAPEARAALKWPNDLLLNDCKVAGILLESASDGDRLSWLAIGVGVNLATHPQPDEVEDGAVPPTSFAAATGAAPDRQAAFALLARRYAVWEQTFVQHGFEPVRAAWLARAHGLGAKADARLPSETLRGVFEDVDAAGALVLNTGAGRRRIAAADIFFA